MTATPTPAERAQAKRLAYLHPGFSPGRVNAIAQALADVRAEVTAKYEAVADDLAAWNHQVEAKIADREQDMYWADQLGLAMGYLRAANKIREVSR